MKVAFFIPLLRTSAIGWRYGLYVCRALARVVDIEIWTPEPVDSIPDAIPIVAFRGDDYPEARLRQADAIVYNLGDNLEFHREIYVIARKHPGIVILHDLLMFNFFHDYYFGPNGGGFTAFASALERHYGARGRDVASRYLVADPMKGPDEMIQYPLFEEAIIGARGVITHSAFLLDRVRDVFAGPSTEIFLAYDAPARYKTAKSALGVPHDTVLLVSMGYLNRNRHITKVIEVLGKDPALARRVRYHLVGPATDAAYLAEIRELIDRYALDDVVTMTGYVDVDRLRAYLGAADVFINLRFPAAEGASATVIEQMRAGGAVVVADTGFYAELPDDTVAKVRLPLDVPGIQEALHALIDDPDRRRMIGSTAQKYVTIRSTADAWVESFLRFADHVARCHAATALIDVVAARATLMGIPPSAPILDAIADECAALLLSSH